MTRVLLFQATDFMKRAIRWRAEKRPWEVRRALASLASLSARLVDFW